MQELSNRICHAVQHAACISLSTPQSCLSAWTLTAWSLGGVGWAYSVQLPHSTGGGAGHPALPHQAAAEAHHGRVSAAPHPPLRLPAPSGADRCRGHHTGACWCMLVGLLTAGQPGDAT